MRTIPPGMYALIQQLHRNGQLQSILSAPPQGGSSPDAAKIRAAYIGFQTLFNNRLKGGSPIYKQIATVVETDNVLDRQIWLQATPKMKRWLGDKTVSRLRAESLPIVTQPHEASLEIPASDIWNDRFGIYKEKINQLGDSYDIANDELAIVMIAAGIQGTTLGTTYDGQNLIDTDHTTLSGGGTAQSNKVTGAFSASVYQTAWQRFLGIKDENNTPVNVLQKRLKLVVGPANRDAARLVLTQDIGAAGARNIDVGTADLIVTPWITAGTRSVLGQSVTLTGLEWFMMPEGSAALIIQHKRGPDFLAVEEGEFRFRTGKYLYGAEAEFGAAYGLWQEIVGGPGA